jgi:ABC-type polysaccharide/polyol phosphate export permease
MIKNSNLWRAHTGRNDIQTALSSPHVWLALGWHDIKQRYRRSVIGPFWFTISTLLMVGALGFVYSTLLNQNIREFLPYLGVGLVVWGYVSSVINEGCSAFIAGSFMIKQARIPLTVHAARVVWRNIVILMHSLPVVLVLMLFFGKYPSWETLMVLPGLFLIFLQGIWVVIVCAIVCTRFRDVVPIVQNAVTVSFFITPVLWPASQLGDRIWIAEYNPLYHTIEVVRAPLMGGDLHWLSWAWSIALLVVGLASAQFLMMRCRDRVSYWI